MVPNMGVREGRSLIQGLVVWTSLATGLEGGRISEWEEPVGLTWTQRGPSPVTPSFLVTCSKVGLTLLLRDSSSCVSCAFLLPPLQRRSCAGVGWGEPFI